ncbi:Thioesterase/thiol ester dehydrase-isomerase [Metschnikowia bicuspidata var. bicuspidata NRRL YB-4993]|uniref:Thioesterase/thiol ester dehydrase-isomerase n=1 Tax=Metschnikowia bicuspidata var. bicuspidata NRRL YB-4993 TaxID=869754 RepID=A0A1A0HFY0_9ASCO|nr:Thioesterase/thiol ester dehydrase-isomerase [Metschnikowia bicuspidata var. bicuspidata NRRL YB-4993]OBA22890.1 Thioesterase/thiol ester dehydrase-isomerase [Metschnikowia bicuspidata var. bicuspidata NRRL YB-4993]
MPGNAEPQNARDFEEATGVHQIDESTWEGNHPLRLPLTGARGVYGGHMCAQTLLVAMKTAPGYVPHSFHSHFIRAGNPKSKCIYKVSSLNDGKAFCQRQVTMLQDGKVTFTAMCSLKKKGVNFKSKVLGDYVHTESMFFKKYKDPSLLYKTYHTDFIVNAFSEEFLNYELCPDERNMQPSERWIHLWSKLHQPQKTKMSDPKLNYIGLAHLSDAAILTTMARALHLEWNPTADNPREEFDSEKDARKIMNVSLNAMHLFHYTAMSLDHHLYFHVDDTDELDVLNDWLFLTYQFMISRNSRTLVRGHFMNKDGVCVATFIQEGLTFMKPGVPGTTGKKFPKL